MLPAVLITALSASITAFATVCVYVTAPEVPLIDLVAGQAQRLTDSAALLQSLSGKGAEI